MTSKYVDGINETNMDAFLEALRSGKYKQGKRQLRTSEGLCCLGVGSELAAADGAVTKYVPEEDENTASYDDEWFLAPKGLLEWLGIPEENTFLSLGNSRNIKLFSTKFSKYNSDLAESFITATELNDDTGLNFAEIADAFEKEFLK